MIIEEQVKTLREIADSFVHIAEEQILVDVLNDAADTIEFLNEKVGYLNRTIEYNERESNRNAAKSYDVGFEDGKRCAEEHNERV